MYRNLSADIVESSDKIQMTTSDNPSISNWAKKTCETTALIVLPIFQELPFLKQSNLFIEKKVVKRSNVLEI